MSVKILAVDDDADQLFALEQLLTREGYEVITAQTGTETLKQATSNHPDLILLDVNMPAPDGYEVTRKLKADAHLRYIPIVLLTARDELDEVVFGLDQGADDYVKKPYQKQELLARVKATLRTRQLYQELKQAHSTSANLRSQLKDRTRFENIIGKSESMNEVFSLIEKVKDSEVPVLVTGESGTGKELVASAIHYHSPRKEKSLVVQNCSAFHENLLESELFGHVKGAFTGAVRDKQGLFEVADQGTFFLDELGEMSAALQVKLLRVLQDGTFMPVGGTATKKVSVRIVAATNRDLRAMVAEGTFREDLFYRLNVINIKLPPLRERRSDIPLLLEHFLKENAKRSGKAQKNLQPETLKVLCNYSWPGNIRELQNEVERIVLLSGEKSEIDTSVLSSHVVNPSSTGPTSKSGIPAGNLKDAVQALEREMITKTLEKVGGNKSEAARELGISRSNLIAKVQEFGLEE